MPVVRLFESEEKARDAAAQVEAAGYDSGVIFVVTPAGSTAAEDDSGDASSASNPSADDLIEMLQPVANLGKSQAITLSREVESGKTMVVVGDPLGYLYKAEKVLDAAGGMQAPISDVSYYSGSGGKLFSSFPFGFPQLTSGLMMSSKDNLMKPGWTAFGSKLSEKGTILSNMLGMKVLSDKGPVFGKNQLRSGTIMTNKLKDH